MATSYAPILLQAFDNYGVMLAGGFIYTYEAGTLTPLVTYQDLEGETENENPVELDAAGRAVVRVTNGVAYKFAITDSLGNPIVTLDDIIVGEQATESFEVNMSFIGEQDTGGGWMGGTILRRAVTFPADFAGPDAAGACETNPAAEQVIAIKVNGVAAGTATFDTDGECYFSTADWGGEIVGVDGDEIDFYGPATPGTGADFKIVLVGLIP